MEKKDVYIGYVGEKKAYESGVVKYPLSFKIDQIDELKKYQTASGNINIDLVIKADGGAFMSVFNPRAATGEKYTASRSGQASVTTEDVPF